MRISARTESFISWAIIAITMFVLATGMSGCEPTTPTSDQATARQTEQLMQEASAAVGLPAIPNWTERRNLKMIYELRDQAIRTYTYTIDMNGQRHLLCESVGYGVPYSTQYSNPERITMHSSYGYGTLPQPEPNGLWTPEGLSATWVLCSDGQGGIVPIYSEPQLVVSPYPLGHVTAAQGSAWNERTSIERVTEPTNIRGQPEG